MFLNSVTALPRYGARPWRRASRPVGPREAPTASHDGIPMLNRQQDASARADHEDESSELRAAQQAVDSVDRCRSAPIVVNGGRGRSDVTPLRGLVAWSVALTLAGLVTAAGCSSGGGSDPVADITRSSSKPTSTAAPSINRGPLAEPVRNDAPKCPGGPPDCRSAGPGRPRLAGRGGRTAVGQGR